MTSDGLSTQEAQSLLLHHGPNALPSEAPKSFLAIALSVLKEPMLLLLVAAGMISFFLADLSDAILLMFTVLIVLTISIYQQQRTEKALQALEDLSSPLALVLRDGMESRIASTELVPGDLLILHEGDRVAADAEIITSSALEFDESLLTGESVPVTKSGGEVAFTGSLVVRGHGRAIVISTGVETALGQIGKSIQEIPYQRTYLQESIDRMVKGIGLFAFLTVIAIVTIYGVTRGNWLEGGLAAIAAAMALIPEEFPVIFTLFMALGAWRMARVKVIARESAAIEALGSVTVLCVDKTGTLTKNMMTVSEMQIDHRIIDGREIHQDFEALDAGRIAALAAPISPFDPMDKAFRSIVDIDPAKDGLESIAEFPVIKERLAYIHIWSTEDEVFAAAKGAPEDIGTLCDLGDDEIQVLTERVKAAGERGFRVLAIAKGRSTDFDPIHPTLDSFQFTFLALAFIKDPIRDGVREAVQECRNAGIRTIMITGDHPTTAKSIASEIGLNDHGQILLGSEISKMSDEELSRFVRNCQIFARVTPEHKLRLIRALQANGEVVGMTGDGVNDAPALRAAEIGIAMGGRGTDVAREAAHLIITDDDFTSIVAGIKRGRSIFSNIQKAMSYVIAIHIPIFGMALTPVLFADWPLILLPALVAFHEVIIDPASSIAFEVEEADPEIMKRPPRKPRSGIFSRFDLSIALLQGLSVFTAVFLVFYFSIDQGAKEERIRSLTFTALVISNVLLILINRSRSLTLWEALIQRRNLALPWIVGGAITLLMILLNVTPVIEAFDLQQLELRDYLILLSISLISLTWYDIFKLVRRRTGHWQDLART